jgi:hypothetical protein
MSTDTPKNGRYSFSDAKAKQPKATTTTTAQTDAQRTSGSPAPVTRHPPGKVVSRTFVKP